MGHAWLKRVMLQGTPAAVLQPRPPQPIRPAGVRSQHRSCFREKGNEDFDSAPPKLSSLLLQTLLVIMWIEAVTELRTLMKAATEHTGKGESLTQQLPLCTPLWKKAARSCA